MGPNQELPAHAKPNASPDRSASTATSSITTTSLHFDVPFCPGTFRHGPVLDMTLLKDKSMHTLPHSALRSIDPVNYANAFVKPKMGYENTFAPTIDKGFAESESTFRLQRPKQCHKFSKRPLRTYSRVAGQDRSEEPLRKKRVIEPTLPEEDKENVPSSPKLPDLPPKIAAPAKKGSILSFFKPVSTSSSSPQSKLASDITAKSDEVAPSSPPSSPPLPSVPEKRKRRLGAKAVVRSSSPFDRIGGHSDGAREEVADERREAKPTGGDEVGTGLSQPRRSSKRQLPKATVQTTLALTDDPAFTICNDCEMLYNPLNEKDKKEHTRRHAAALRRKRMEKTPAAEE